MVVAGSQGKVMRGHRGVLVAFVMVQEGKRFLKEFVRDLDI
jgi:hypothetical protein